MLIPELPGYLIALGGEEYLGLIISLFTLTAGLSRPFSGKLADKIGRIPVMVFGASVCFVVSLLYPVMTTVAGFLFLRFIHGFSTGFTPTGTSAFVADIVPMHRRGEALGMHSLFATMGMAAGPALGGWLATMYSINVLFVVSAGVAILSILILIRLNETLPQKEPLKLSMFRLKKDELLERRVLHPSMVLFFVVFPFGIVLTITPALSEFVGIANKGLFFAVFTIASMSIRFFAGKSSDRFGRIPVLKASATVLFLAMIVVAFATTKWQLLSGAVLFGLATGMGSPTATAWTIDLSLDAYRGRALATMYIALEAGIGLGALISGTLYSPSTKNFGLVFGLGAGAALLALAYLFFVVPKRKKEDA